MALTAFQQRLDRVLRANELGGASPYNLHWAGTPESGWTFGVPQWELGQGNSNAAKLNRLRLILLNAQDANGNYIVEDSDANTGRGTLAAIEDTLILDLVVKAQTLGGQGLTAAESTLINSALNSTYGQNLIDTDYEAYLDDELEPVADRVTNLTTGADRTFLESNLARIWLCDFENQFGISPGGLLEQFVQGGTVYGITKQGTLGVDDLLNFYFHTAYAQSRPYDVIRRFTNIVDETGYTPSNTAEAINVFRAYSYLASDPNLEIASSYRNNFATHVLSPARNLVVAALESQYEELGDLAGFTSTRIFLDSMAGNHSSVIDSRVSNNGVEIVRADLVVGDGGADVIWGGQGDDVLVGGAGADSLFGGTGDDVLHGWDSDKDALIGEEGLDVYYAGGGDLVRDSDGTGIIYVPHEDGPVPLGNGFRTGNSGLYYSIDGQTSYEELANGNIIARVEGVGVITIQGPPPANGRYHFQDGEYTIGGQPGLGVALFSYPRPQQPGGPSPEDQPNEPWPEAPWALAGSDPLVLDLNGNGISTRGISAGAHFDFDGDGFAQQAGWIESTDGLLARDLNGDGRINSGAELFSDFTQLSSGDVAINGAVALADMDSNSDGKVDASDAGWEQLRIWVDADTDGYTDAGELKTLAELNIASLSTSYTPSGIIDSHNNIHASRGSFTRLDGSSGLAEELWFWENRTDSLQEALVAVSDTVRDLPNLIGTGTVRDLHQAMMHDTSGNLVALVQQFADESDRAARLVLMEQILFAWSGADAVDPMSRGPFMDARRVHTLEMFRGENLLATIGTASIIQFQADRLEPLFTLISDTFYSQLMRQSHFSEATDGLSITRDAQSGRTVGLGASVTTATNTILQEGGTQADVDDFIAVVRGSFGIDLQFGSSAGEQISSVADQSELHGLGGNDFLASNQGDDSLYGGDGDDYLDGFSGNDLLNGGAGADHLLGGDGEDVLEGGDGNDLLFGGAGSNYLFGGAGDDGLTAEGISDTLDGGSGNDTLTGSTTEEATGDIFVFGRGYGVDTIYVNDPQPGKVDIVRFDSSVLPSDIVSFQSGSDRVFQISGTNDQLVISGWYTNLAFTIERFEFADGTVWDRGSLTSISGNETANFLDGTAADDVIRGLGGDDTIFSNAGSDYVEGNDGNDWIEGNAGNDLLVGGAGDDNIVGGDDHDTLDGGVGSDQLAGEAGSDVYIFGRGYGADLLTDTGGALDVIRFAPGVSQDDVLMFSEGTDRVFQIIGTTDRITVQNWDSGIERVEFADGSIWDSAYLARSIILGTENADSLNGLADDDLIYGYGGADSLAGDDGNDRLDGGNGADYLAGDSGNDLLLGGADGDILLGGSGDDDLTGGTGNDWISGGVSEEGSETFDTGADTIRFSRGDGNDTISDPDSSASVDRLVFSGVTSTQVNAFRRDNQLVIEVLGTSDTVTVLNWGLGTSYQIERIEFGDGIVWTGAEVAANAQVLGNQLDNFEGGSQFDDFIRTFGGYDQIEAGAGNDWIDGGTEDDTMVGGLGNDTYVVDTEFDVVTELSGQGTDEVIASIDYVLGSNLEGLVIINAALNATGNSLANSLTGNSNDNILDGKAGADSMYGDAGNDTYIVDNAGDVVTENANSGTDLVQSSVAFTLGANVENLTLTGSGSVAGTGNSLNNTLTGNSGINTLSGGAGQDTLNGGGGDDTLIGGTGDDLYVVAQAGDTATELADEGVDLVQSSVTFPLSSNVENLTLTGSSALGGTGNSSDNILIGNSGINTLTALGGNDTLDGGAGADTLVGGLGNDLYVVDHASEIVTEAVDEGADSVVASVSHTLHANVENLTLAGTNAINGTGNALTNTITGNSAANTLNGLAGADTLIGGAGDDTYVVDDVLDVVTELASEGVDTVQSAVSYSLAANVENLTLTGSAAIDATGNELDNVLAGNSGTNTLSGGLGNDTYVVNGTADVVVENVSEGTDLVQASVTYTLSANVEQLTLIGASAISATGNALDNVLTGNTAINTLTGAQGNDTLNGGAAADILIGGAGDDLYIVDDAGDAITEVGGEGTDTVESSVTYTLAAEVERLTLTGTAAINGTGNGLDNILIGNNGANTLSGGAGADSMTGGLGNDTYVVDSAGDVVVENAASGTDTVQAAITYTAGTNVENVTLTGSTAINATGNELNNTLRGNTGANVLTGGLGNDTYVVNNTTDTVVESAAEGMDLVQSSVTYTLASNVENLTLTGSAVINATGNELDNVLIGNTGVNILTGGGGNDTLDGGTSVDTMAGGAGDDTYIVEVAGETVTENASEGTDTVQASVTYTLAANVENLVLTGAAAINGTGNGLNNGLTGNSAVNTLNGGVGADTMIGGGDNDIYVVDDVGDTVVENAAEGTDTVQSTVSYTLASNVERITLTGAAAVNATGNDLDNLITGNSAVNTLSGGLGNDTYVVGSGDLVVEAADEGTDLVQSAISFSLASNVENLTLTGSAAVDATGNELNNVLTGNTGVNTLNGGQGNDTLNGGTGADSLLGGTGDDTYVVDNVGDTVTENSAEGIDLVQSSVTYTLAANFENLTLTGSSAINATGNDLDNVLTGNSGVNTLTGGQGNDTLNGAAGADVLIGGVGDDTYTVDNAGDSVTENAAEGTDTVLASIAYTLGATLENLTLTGSSAIAGTGNALDNVLTGNTGVNVLTGGLGNDTYYVNNTTDTAVENAAEGTDSVFSSVSFTLGANVESLTLTGTASINATGNGADNALNGNSGNNTLNGGAGADTMSGDVGNDTYVVDDVGDVIVESTDAGTDTVQSTLSYSLGSNLENLTLTGAAAIDATGNSLDNVLIGNTGVNTLNGGAGNDTLNGGSGNDTMLGGTGDDIYVIAQAGDVVTELDGEGTDLVQSSITHTLSSFVENLTLTGSSNVNAVGNTLDNLLFGNTGTNTLTGNAGNDTLDGSGGFDTMVGGDGDDTYYSDLTGETITEAASQGLDRVYSATTQTLAANVEMLFLTGSALINGTGNAASNLLRGNDVRNVLVGGGGIDILEGGAGNDSLSNTGGGLFNGGSGNDTLTGGAGHDLFIGGTGSDAITTSTGRDVIAFNLGDGADSVSSSTTLDNTLSIGGGATYADLLFERVGNNLILKVGSSDQITLTNYYTGSNHSLGTLQIVIEGTSDYDANSANALINKKIESFDFDGLVAAFDSARANDPLLTSWALTNALLAEHLGGSDSAAIGGDLAYEYARFGTLGAVSYVPALGILASGTFGQSAQTFQGPVGMQDTSPRLS